MNKNKRGVVVAVLLIMMIVCSLGIFAPEVKASPNIQIAVGRGFLNADNDYVVVGEVKNAGSQAVTEVQITVNGYDASNKLVWSGDATADLAVINPGARSGFITGTTYGGQSSSIDHLSATLTSATETTNTPVSLQLTVTNATLGTTPSIIGTLTDYGTNESGVVNIYVTYYDSQGKAAGTGSYQFDVTDPGDSGPFEADVDNMAANANVTFYMVTADSVDDAGTPGQYVAAEVATIAFNPQVTTSASSTPVLSLTSALATSSPLTSQAASPLPSQTASPLTGQTAPTSTSQTQTASPSARGSFPLWIVLVALAAVVAVVVAFVFLRKRPRTESLQPMPPPPPPP